MSLSSNLVYAILFTLFQHQHLSESRVSFKWQKEYLQAQMFIN